MFFFNWVGAENGTAFLCSTSAIWIRNPYLWTVLRIRLFSIPDPGSASKNLSILILKKPKNGFSALENMIRVVHPGSRIRMLTFYPSRIPDPGVKKAPDPGSGSATLPLVWGLGTADLTAGVARILTPVLAPWSTSSLVSASSSSCCTGADSLPDIWQHDFPSNNWLWKTTSRHLCFVFFVKSFI